MKKRVFAILLVIATLIGYVPTKVAYADDPVEVPGVGKDLYSIPDDSSYLSIYEDMNGISKVIISDFRGDAGNPYDIVAVLEQQFRCKIFYTFEDVADVYNTAGALDWDRYFVIGYGGLLQEDTDSWFIAFVNVDGFGKSRELLLDEYGRMHVKELDAALRKLNKSETRLFKDFSLMKNSGVAHFPKSLDDGNYKFSITGKCTSLPNSLYELFEEISESDPFDQESPWVENTKEYLEGLLRLQYHTRYTYTGGFEVNEGNRGTEREYVVLRGEKNSRVSLITGKNGQLKTLRVIDESGLSEDIDVQVFADNSSWDNQSSKDYTQLLAGILEQDFTGYPALQGFKDSLQSVISGIVEANNKHVAENSKEQANNIFDTYRNLGWDKLTTYQKWWCKIHYCFTEGSNFSATIPDELGFYRGTSTDLKTTTLPGLLTSFREGKYTDSDLTLEEFIRLYTFIQMKYNTLSAEDQFLFEEAQFWTSGFDISQFIPADKVYQGASGYDLTTVRRDYLQMYNSIPSNYRDTTAVIALDDVVYNFEAVTKYLVRLTYGDTYSEEESSTEGEEDASSIAPIPYIESLIPSISDWEIKINGVTSVPELSRIKYIAKTELAQVSYQNLLYLVTIANEYANSELSSGIVQKEDGTYANETLEAFIATHPADKTDLDSLYQGTDSECRNWITTYKSICAGLEYLGVEGSFVRELPALQALMNYYPQIISYKTTTTTVVYKADEEEPLRMFFNVKDKVLSDYYRQGVLLSSTYIPMKTNMYNVDSVSGLESLGFVMDFHYAFGFYRKALYIDTNSNAAMDAYIAKISGEKRVATLKDLLQPEKEIVLYLDDNFYNVGDIAQYQGYVYNKLQNTADAEDTTAIFSSDWWSSLWEEDIENIVKTGATSSYSSNIKDQVSEYRSVKDRTGNPSGTQYVLSDAMIDKYLTVSQPRLETGAEEGEIAGEGNGSTASPTPVISVTPTPAPSPIPVYDEYTPLQSFAVVSAIYRHSALFNTVKKFNGADSAVFISSPTLATKAPQGTVYYNSIFNYAMLKNLEGSLGIDYKTTLDLNSPIYMDIYGNILTESGLVIIPAMSNATLVDPALWSPYTIGFATLYANGWHIPGDYEGMGQYTENRFTLNEDSNTYELSSIRVYGYALNFKHLSISADETIKAIMQINKSAINSKGALPFNQRVGIITEVLRGAPIENIDKTFEGLSGSKTVTKTGIYLAYKLDELADALLSSSNGNSLLTLPNLAYMDGVEYVVVFGFKIMFAVCIILLAYRIYLDSVVGRLGTKTFTRFVASLAGFVVIVSIVPTALNVSYNEANKLLLQEEISDIVLLNLEKQYEGKEIGITEVDEPESSTKVYLELSQVEIPWYKLLGDVLGSDILITMEDLYEDSFKSNPMSNLKGIIKKSNGLYLDTNTLFDSTTIQYVPDSYGLINVVETEPYASYCMPYYYFLDAIIQKMNKYNNDDINGVLSYATKIQKGGHIRTSGLSEAFFTSNYFMMESRDIMGVLSIYDAPRSLIEAELPNIEEARTAARGSLWYYSDLTDKAIEERVAELNLYARRFVVRHKDLLGKVTDEAFIKVFALAMSIKYNQLFGVPVCNGLELFEVDTKDIMRLSIADTSTVLSESSKSFARFVYDHAGTLGVFMTALLVVVYFVASVIRPVSLIIVIVCMAWGLIVRRLVKRDRDSAIEGFIISFALMCGSNILYALVLKVAILIPNTGVTSVFGIVLQLILQIVYLCLMALLVKTVLSDIKNIGADKYSLFAQKAVHNVQNSVMHAGSVVFHTGYQGYQNVRRSHAHRSTKGLTGSGIYQQMLERDYKRHAKAETMQSYQRTVERDYKRHSRKQM